MVLAQLGRSISRALAQMSNTTVVDEKALADCLNEISRALLQSDVQFKAVRDMQCNIKRIVNLEAVAAGTNKRRVIQQAVFAELCRMLDPGKPAFAPAKGKPCVVMFVGLQGSGKTTTCTKYAYYHRRRGHRPALVCADTFRAGAFDQLKQNAAKARIPFYGSYTESDQVRIAADGVDMFRKEGSDLIVVDTSGRHRQEAALFEEMRQVAAATKPDLVIFVMDGSIGQAAFDQAQAFRQTAAVGAVIVTKMDGHAKGGGALSAVAATKSPVIFIGTGEHIDDFQPFDVKPFVSRLLGMGDLSGLVNKIQDAMPADDQNPEELLKKLTQKGSFTLRLMYDQYQMLLKMGPIGDVFSMVPGFRAELMPKGKENEAQAKVKRYTTIMDSMTNAELDSTDIKLLMTESRIIRIARGSGRQPKDVTEMLEEYKRLAKMFSKIKMPKIPIRNNNKRNNNPRLDQITNALDPALGGLPNIMKQLGGVDLRKILGGMGIRGG